jgi:large subunit ribosomal protein L30
VTPKKTSNAMLQVRQIKSAIGFSGDQGATLKAMGLGKIGRVRQLPDNAQIRGMIFKIKHLVVVENATDQG